MNKKLNSQANKVSKYSLRKGTTGATSILIGAIFILAIGNNQAKANERENLEETYQSNQNQELTSRKSEQTAVQFKNVDSEKNINEQASNLQHTNRPQENQSTVKKHTSNNSEKELKSPFSSPRSKKSELNFMNYSAPNTSSNSDTENNVTSKINFSNTDIKFKDNKIRPINAESYNLNISFNVDTNMKSGDYFKFQGSQNTINDDLNHNNSYAPDIKDSNGETIANGLYNPIQKEYTYTFTDYVNNKKNITGNINLSQYIDRNMVRNDSIAEHISYTFGDKKISQKIDVIYDNSYETQDQSNIGAAFTHYNQQTKTYEQIIYVNPLNKYTKSSLVDIMGYKQNNGDSSAQVNQETQIKIYKLKDGKSLNASYFNDDEDLIDVTNNFDIYNYENAKRINFGNINRDTYIIKVVSKENDQTKKDLIQSVRMYSFYNQRDYDTVYYYNYIQLTDSDADGDGEPDSDSDSDSDSD
ncbi:hypothetical protein AXF02_09565, partial [Staphylococcus aureus]